MRFSASVWAQGRGHTLRLAVIYLQAAPCTAGEAGPERGLSGPQPVAPGAPSTLDILDGGALAEPYALADRARRRAADTQLGRYLSESFHNMWQPSSLSRV